MFGGRKRIGYIAPTVIEVVAYDFYRFAPEGVGLVGVTCGIGDWKAEEFEKGLAQVNAFAEYLGTRGVDYVIHGGGPLVVARGKGYEEEIVRNIEAASGVGAGFKELQNVPPPEIYRFARGVLERAGDCDALYLPCPQWQAAEVVPALEEDSGKTAVAYIHANFFAAFQALGLCDPIRGHGRLLASLAG